MPSTANVVLLLGYVQGAERLAKNTTLTAKYAKKREFYSGTSGALDYLRYVNEGTKEQNKYIEDGYLGYSGNYEKSSGVFNACGLVDKKGRAELRAKLRKTESTIWHGILSFEESFGIRYCADMQDAWRLMNMEIPKFFKSAGFDPSKMEWFAGLHENTDNRHIHFSFFEKEPSRYSPHHKGLKFSMGAISQRHFNKFKINIEYRLTDISSEIKIARKELTEFSKELLFSHANKTMYHGKLQAGIQRLAELLPAKGRLSYDSDNMQFLKPYVKGIVNSVIKSDKKLYTSFEDFCVKVRNRDTKTIEMLKSNKVKKSEWSQYLIADKYLEDIYRRLGNQVITAVRIIKGRERSAKGRLARKHIRRRTVLSLLEYTLRLNSEIEQEAHDAFAELLDKLASEEVDYKEERVFE